MSSDTSRPVSFRSHSWKWVLYVVLALFGGSLTFVGARAQQKATEEATFRKLIDDYCAAWSSGNPDIAAKYYAQEEGVVFYDVAPFSYHNWKEYRAGVQKEFFDNLSAAKLTAGKDLKVTKRGMIAWTTVTMHLSTTGKDGKTSEYEIRYTGIWEKRGVHWILVHEHLSAPLS
ncbi:MAG TPA: nuclear transport factor 2 family protein [Candidatus Acidoferrum sp.]|nr:nuclear transport factor 2 family protein [Candidatus Acidoferrum sp.]